jgi:hypothetical protein
LEHTLHTFWKLGRALGPNNNAINICLPQLFVYKVMLFTTDLTDELNKSYGWKYNLQQKIIHHCLSRTNNIVPTDVKGKDRYIWNLETSYLCQIILNT